jgi:hypothetical protein
VKVEVVVEDVVLVVSKEIVENSVCVKDVVVVVIVKNENVSVKVVEVLVEESIVVVSEVTEKPV